MKSTKRLLCLLLCAVMVLSLLTACGGQSGETTPSAPTTESTTNAPTETITEVTTEPTDAPTEPLPTEINSWYNENGDRIGETVNTYDRQGNLVKIEDHLQYDDGDTYTEISCYDSSGNLIEYTVNHYDGNGRVLADSYAVFEPSSGLWDVDGEWTSGSTYYVDSVGSEEYPTLIHARGLFTCYDPSDPSDLVEGVYQRYENDTLFEDCEISFDGTGYKYRYRNDGSLWSSVEIRFIPDTNVRISRRIDYAEDDSIYFFEEEYVDSIGNLIKSVLNSYDNGVFEYSSVYEYQYDSNNNLVFETSYTADINGKKHEDSAEFKIYYSYNTNNQCISKESVILDGELTMTDTSTFEYNTQGLVSKKHVVSVISDIEGYHSEQFYEYEYNEQGLRIQEYKCDPDADIRGDSETYTIYTYDENGNCILVEIAKFVAGEQTDYDAFESDGSGYIYGEYSTRLYPYSDPLTDY